MIEGEQEIEPLGPGYGYRVRLFWNGQRLELGNAESIDEALEKLNRAREGLR